MKKHDYNTTQLEPLLAIEKGIMHRDMNAHVFRWTHVLKNAKIGQTIVDFGAGKCNLLEVMYRNRYKPAKYIGLEFSKVDVDFANEKFKKVNFPIEIYQQDIVKPELDFTTFQADIVVSFEVAEHVGKQNVPTFLANFKKCGNKNATYYLSTPNYDPKVGAAGNHTYDSNDGNGVQPQELDHFELRDMIFDAGFKIKEVFGTFASQKDYKNDLNDWQLKTFEALSRYYDSNMVSNIMAPILNDPSKARNSLWVLTK